MKTTINVNGKDVEIELTDAQVQQIKKASEKITDRIKNFQDVLDYLGLSDKAWKTQILGLADDELAYKQVKLIALALNEGAEMDAFNEDQYKYYPYFEVQENGFSCLNYTSWHSNTHVSSRLCFKSAELAIYAGKTFTEIYTKFLS